MKLDDLLEMATPPPSPTPTKASIEAVVNARRDRRRRGGIALAGVGLVVGISTIAMTGNNGGQLLETTVADSTPIDQAPADSAPDSAAEFDGAEPNDAAEPKDAGQSSLPSEIRWFLVPPPEVELRFIDDGGYLWSKAQGNFDERDVVVTTNLQDQSIGGEAWVYYLDDVGVEITDGPEEFTETFREEVIDGRTVRVGSDPLTDSVKVFAEWEPGLVAFVGYNMTEDQALAVVLAAGVEDGAIFLGEQRLPDGVAVAVPPAPRATDHTTNLGWGDEADQVRLATRPGTLASAKMFAGEGRGPIPVDVRGGAGLFYQSATNQVAATLAWEEDGYQFILELGDEDEDRSADELVTIAESLVRVDQPTLIDRFDDEFMRGQVAIVQGWFDATPLPPGWEQFEFDLVHSVPDGSYTTAKNIHQFLNCAWWAEWLDAGERGDATRQQAAFDVLASRSDWPIVQAEIAAAAAIPGITDPEADLQRWFESDLELLTQITSADQADPYGDRGCSFEVSS